MLGAGGGALAQSLLEVTGSTLCHRWPPVPRDYLGKPTALTGFVAGTVAPGIAAVRGMARASMECPGAA